MTICVYVAMIILLATSTLFTHSIYSSWWFFSFWAVIATTLLIAIFKHKLFRNIPSMLLHCSFLLILSGGAITFIFGERGFVELQPGESTSKFTLENSGDTATLPSTITLDSFVIVNHQASKIPRDYISYLSVNGENHCVSVNNIIVIDDYRLYQTSYNNHGGSILSVNHDPYGISLTYTGYTIFAIATILLLCSRNGRFRTYLRKATLLLCLLAPASFINATTIKGIPTEDANLMSRKQIYYNGRITPFNTLACDFVKKITGSSNFSTLTPEQVVASWILYPDDWKAQPFILIKSERLRSLLGVDKKFISYNQLFTPDGDYRLRELFFTSTDDLRQDILELDEKVELIYNLLNNKLVKPISSTTTPLSDGRISAEIAYNKIPFSKIYSISAITLALVFLSIVIIKRRIYCSMVIIVSMLLTFLCLGYCLKWYIAQSIPLSNGPETMQFLSIMIGLFSIILHRRNIYILPLSLLLSGFFCLVASIGDSNPIVSPLIPVLNSPWLSIHVSVIMISYALLSLTMLISLIALFIKNERVRLMWLNKALLYPGILFLGGGIFLGAVWANVSWGRYWGWDPKEVWALITFLIYAIPLHTSLLPGLKDETRFHSFCVLAFLSVLITYFGVNFFLGGLHSYA